jgi:outer membrane lipoprotein SlyB
VSGQQQQQFEMGLIMNAITGLVEGIQDGGIGGGNVLGSIAENIVGGPAGAALDAAITGIGGAFSGGPRPGQPGVMGRDFGKSYSLSYVA